MGNFHPHGDASIYDTLVRLAQDFNMRYPTGGRPGQLRLDRRRSAGGHAATPKRGCKSLADDMMTDLDKETVDFTPNYDETTEEPTVLPGAVSEPARQRLGRHRRRHGDQRPAAQPARGHRRRASG